MREVQPPWQGAAEHILVRSQVQTGVGICYDSGQLHPRLSVLLGGFPLRCIYTRLYVKAFFAFVHSANVYFSITTPD